MKVREIKVTQRNQITIPYTLRSELKWFKPGATIKVTIQDKNTIVLHPGKAKPEKQTKPKKRKTDLLTKVAFRGAYKGVLD